MKENSGGAGSSLPSIAEPSKRSTSSASSSSSLPRVPDRQRASPRAGTTGTAGSSALSSMATTSPHRQRSSASSSSLSALPLIDPGTKRVQSGPDSSLSPMHEQGVSASSAASSSVPARPVSPRSVPQQELAAMGLERFVRLEKVTPMPSPDPDYVQVSKAKHLQSTEKKRVEKFQSEGKGPGAVQERKKALAEQEARLAVASQAKGNPQRADVQQLMQIHATSSAHSPFMSITQGFTTGQNSQAYYFDRGDGNGNYASVSIFNTGRSFVNPINTREQEHLLPIGIQRRELAGTFTRGKAGYTYTDLSGDSPRHITGPEAVERFNLEAGSNYTAPASTPAPARKKG